MRKYDDVKVKVVRKTGFFGTLLCLIVLLGIGAFSYKRIVLDCNGKFATGRMIYSGEYGLCLLIAYYPEYRNNDIKGFALTNIPLKTVLNGTVRGSTYCNSTVNSEELYNEYETLSSFSGYNAITDTLLDIFVNSSFSTQVYDIDFYGKYFIHSLRGDDF